MRFELDVPFFPNPEDFHCYQACLKMGLKHFLPRKKFGLNRLNTICDPKNGGGCMPLASLTWLREHGMETFYASTFDYRQFLADPKAYLVSRYGKYDVALMEIDGYIDWAVLQVERHLSKSGWEFSEPNMKQLKHHIRNGFAVICGISPHEIDPEKSQRGHAVVVKGFTRSTFILHDPGLPARPNWPVPSDLFEAAWSSRHIRGRDLIAFRLKQNKI